MNWSAVESRVTLLPGFDPAWLPSGAFQYLHIIRRDGVPGLDVGPYVGTIPLNNGDTLRLTPKCGEMPFLRMLLSCESLFSEARTTFDRFSKYSSGNDGDFSKLVRQAFIESIEVILATSLRPERRKVTRVASYAMGAVVPTATAFRLQGRLEPPVVSQASEKTLDTAENRVLSAAALSARRMSQDLGKPEQQVIEDWLRRCRHHVMHPGDLAEVARLILRGQAGGSRGYYVPALNLARVILGQIGLTQNSEGPLLADSLIINTPTLFEDYVRNRIRVAYQDKGLLVRKGSLAGRYLYLDGSYQMIPDVTIWRAEKLLLICDAKYKEVDQSDHYQMLNYLEEFGVGVGILIFPGTGEPRRKKTATGRAVIELPIPITDLEAAEGVLGSVLQLATN